jgi:hypothetical protein
MSSAGQNSDTLRHSIPHFTLFFDVTTCLTIDPAPLAMPPQSAPTFRLLQPAAQHHNLIAAMGFRRICADCREMRSRRYRVWSLACPYTRFLAYGTMEMSRHQPRAARTINVVPMRRASAFFICPNSPPYNEISSYAANNTWKKMSERVARTASLYS